MTNSLSWEDQMVLQVVTLPGHRLLIRFADGWRLLDLSVEVAHSGILARIFDPKEFAKVWVDGWGCLIWPAGVEIAGDTLYQDSEPVDDEEAMRVLRGAGWA